MLLSMTGHGAAHQQQDDLSVSAEVRTVNNRYYKLALRISEGYSTLEPRLDEIVRKYVRRGTVQVDVKIDRRSSADDFHINQTVLQSYYRQLQKVVQDLGSRDALQLELLLTLPGVIEEGGASSHDSDAAWPLIESTLRTALESLSAFRAGEGQAMENDLVENCRLIRAELQAIADRAPQIVDQFRQRVTDRVNKLLADHEVRVETADVLREMALFAERSDFSEEVVRLNSHLEQFLEIIKLEESNGRKLEFVTQEMFRETNTIGSKCNDADVARHVIEIKAAIERVREMIQNIE